jgi:hypothetical protein
MCRVHAVDDAEDGPALRGARRAGLVVARRDHHRFGVHQRLDQLGGAVAQRDVDEGVVDDRRLAAGARRAHAVQHHAEDAPRIRVVVAVGVPADGTVGVGDEFAAGR